MTILITGATGLLGRNLVNQLSKKDTHEIIALGRDKEKLILLEKDGVQPVKFDLTEDYSSFLELSQYGGEDSCWIHCASAISGASDEVLEQVNIGGTKKLVRIAEDQNVDQFILISSLSTYDTSQEGPYHEEDRQNPATTYGETKLQQEKMIKSSNLNWTILRPPFIAGPQDENFLVEFAKRIKQNTLPKVTKPGTIGVVDARDLASVIVDIINTTTYTEEIFNIQGEGVLLDDFVKLLADKIEVENPYMIKIPYWLAMFVGTMADIFNTILRRPKGRKISRYRIRTLCMNRSLNIKKAKEALNFEPKYPLETMIEDWLHNSKYAQQLKND